MSNIETLHTLYLVTMTASAIMLVLTIVLFFVFDIRHVIGKLFGFAERKAVKKLKENTAFTSQLNNKYNQRLKGQIYTDTGSLKKKQTPAERLGMTGTEANSKRLKKWNEEVSQAQQTPISQIDEGNSQTTALSVGAASPVTSVSDEMQTTVLGASAGSSQNNAVPNLQFTIIRQIVMIHTEESIEIS